MSKSIVTIRKPCVCSGCGRAMKPGETAGRSARLVFCLACLAQGPCKIATRILANDDKAVLSLAKVFLKGGKHK
jgi:hypothetical protein